MPEFSDVFVSGEMGFLKIRIPSVVVTNVGTVLAFAESRDNNRFDQGSNKLLLRRSPDHGATWGPLEIVVDDGEQALNNPCAVVERESGTIFLMYQRLPPNLNADSYMIETGYEGPYIQRSFVTTSEDDGITWSVPRDITEAVKRPTSATTICSGPGIGIQLTRGPHAGRLIVPFSEGPFHAWNNYAVYSDDRGATWLRGDNVPGVFLTDDQGRVRSQVNEPQVAETSDGSVLLNTRPWVGAQLRKASLSSDGGQTWTMLRDVPELVDGSCMGSVLRYSFGQGRENVLLYAGSHSVDRTNGSIHVSFDDGQSWTSRRTLEPGPYAYSVLTKLSDGKVGCLFEADHAQRIRFARFDLEWVLEPYTR